MCYGIVSYPPLDVTALIIRLLLIKPKLTGGEAKRQGGELPEELPGSEPAYVGTGTGQAREETQNAAPHYSVL